MSENRLSHAAAYNKALMACKGRNIPIARDFTGVLAITLFWVSRRLELSEDGAAATYGRTPRRRHAVVGG